MNIFEEIRTRIVTNITDQLILEINILPDPTFLYLLIATIVRLMFSLLFVSSTEVDNFPYFSPHRIPLGLSMREIRAKELAPSRLHTIGRLSSLFERPSLAEWNADGGTAENIAPRATRKLPGDRPKINKGLLERCRAQIKPVLRLLMLSASFFFNNLPLEKLLEIVSSIS